VYAGINGLKMFYEIRGTPDRSRSPWSCCLVVFNYRQACWRGSRTQTLPGPDSLCFRRSHPGPPEGTNAREPGQEPRHQSRQQPGPMSVTKA